MAASTVKLETIDNEQLEDIFSGEKLSNVNAGITLQDTTDESFAMQRSTVKSSAMESNTDESLAMQSTAVKDPALESTSVSEDQSQDVNILYKCDICKEIYAQLAEVEEHMKVHTDGTKPTSKPCKCRICNKNFMDQESLQKHCEKHKPRVQRRRKVLCDLCG